MANLGTGGPRSRARSLILEIFAVSQLECLVGDFLMDIKPMVSVSTQ